MPKPLGPVPLTDTRSLDDFLKFDADAKMESVPFGTDEAIFTFTVTNVSSEEVTIGYIVGSCQCTVAKLPSSPWKLSPKSVGNFTATMQLAGTPAGESKTKQLTVGADKGIKQLNVTTRVLPDMSTGEARTNAVKMATADRMAVFKGDCMQCHADTSKDSSGHDKLGHDLYASVCGVCHESERRATFVPDLHHLKEPTSAEFWRAWIMNGKAGSLMPAFAKSEGGILSGEQIDSLVKYLSANIPAQPAMLAPPGNVRVSP